MGILHQIFTILSIFTVCALGKEHIPIDLNVETDLQTVECKQFKYYTVEVTDPCMDLRVRVHHIQGEPDLYVSRGNTKFPTDSSLAWTSYEWGSEELVISSWDPEFEVGMFYIGVHAYCGDDLSPDHIPSKFTILVQNVPTTHPHSEITPDGPINGERVDAQGYKYYRFCVPSKSTDVEVKLANCLDSAVCPTSYGYPELLVSRSIVTPTIKDHSWKLATIERRSVYLKRDDPDVHPGHHFVAVYGWCTPDEHCEDKTLCGPCEYVPNMVFNVSVIMENSGSGSCNPSFIVACLCLAVLSLFK